MKKEKLMALILAIVMMGSVGGFAFSFIGFGSPGQQPHSQQNQQGQQTTISSVINRELTSQEVSSILQAGGIIIENFYPSDCTDCESSNNILENFANKFSRFVVLSQIPINSMSTPEGDIEETFRMIVGSGQIIELNRTEITDAYLLDTFCNVAPVQPAECILRQI